MSEIYKEETKDIYKKTKTLGKPPSKWIWAEVQKVAPDLIYWQN